MEFSTLLLYLTERCNFRCSYCYQLRGRQTMTPAVLDRALDVFLPHLAARSEIHFYGGEPLVAFDLIRRAVAAVENKNGGRRIRFGLTTNGSLITDDILAFFRDHRFRLLVSFDGLAQHVGREQESTATVLPALERLVDAPEIRVETNSVFTPKTVRYLSGSVRLIHELGVRDIHLAFSNLEPWSGAALTALGDELAAIRRFAGAWRKKTGRVPLAEFRPGRGRGIFVCGGGTNRIAVAPDGTVWGCHLFIDHFRGRSTSREARSYSFGRVGRFVGSGRRAHPAVAARYASLRMTRFMTPDGPCLTCPEVEDCAICPLDAAAPGTEIGRIPRWACRIAKELRTAREKFLASKILSRR
jgi:sulfatase maturation enzyme AslB (radical SAM superfamily)